MDVFFYCCYMSRIGRFDVKLYTVSFLVGILEILTVNNAFKCVEGEFFMVKHAPLKETACYMLGLFRFISKPV